MRLHTLVLLSLVLPVEPAMAQEQPNIVFIFMNNFGYGELGVYGGSITRGALTPRIDALASEGFRPTNIIFEAQCTPTRSALMTGQIRSVPATAEYRLIWHSAAARVLRQTPGCCRRLGFAHAKEGNHYQSFSPGWLASI